MYAVYFYSENIIFVDKFVRLVRFQSFELVAFRTITNIIFGQRSAKRFLSEEEKKEKEKKQVREKERRR